jgi:hypothetical protein
VCVCVYSALVTETILITIEQIANAHRRRVVDAAHVEQFERCGADRRAVVAIVKCHHIRTIAQRTRPNVHALNCLKLLTMSPSRTMNTHCDIRVDAIIRYRRHFRQTPVLCPCTREQQSSAE